MALRLLLMMTVEESYSIHIPLFFAPRMSMWVERGLRGCQDDEVQEFASTTEYIVKNVRTRLCCPVSKHQVSIFTALPLKLPTIMASRIASSNILSKLIALPAELRSEIYYYIIYNHFNAVGPAPPPPLHIKPLTERPILREEIQLYGYPLHKNIRWCTDVIIVADTTLILRMHFTFNFAHVLFVRKKSCT